MSTATGTLPEVDNAIYELVKSCTLLEQELGDRIYCAELPSKCTYPALVYDLIQDESEDTLDGLAGLAHANYIFTFLTESRDQGGALATTFKRLISNFQGEIAGVDLQELSYEHGDRPVWVEEHQAWDKSCTVNISWTEAQSDGAE